MSTDDGEVCPLLKLGGLQNKHWLENKNSNFGYQMLMKMGWKEGNGLGKNEDGIATHVKVDKRTDNLGLGATVDIVGSEGWSATRNSFGDLLASLNQEFTDPETAAKEAKLKRKLEKKRKKAEAKEKGAEGTSNAPKNKLLYKKWLKSKNMGGYDAIAMAEIFGKTMPGEGADTGKSSKKKKKSKSGEKGKKKRKTDDASGESDTAGDGEKSAKKKAKKDKKRKRSEGEGEDCENTGQCKSDEVTKKKKKDKKSKKVKEGA